MADITNLLDVLKIDGVIYEIHDKKARTDIAALYTSAQSTYATKTELSSETSARTTAINNAKAELMGTVADAVDADTIKGLRNALNNLSSVDETTLATIRKIESELEDPENTNLTTFLDKITSLISGFNTDTTAEGYKTIKRYIDDINTALTTTLSGKANQTDVDTAISGVQGRIGTLETKEANDITGVQSQISTLSTKEANDITGVQSQIDALSTKEATDIQGVQGTIESEISDVKTIIINNEKVISAALNDLESRKANSTDIDEAITGVQGQITTVDTKVTGVQTSITGTDADTTNDLTLHGLKKSYEALSTTISGADTGILAVLQKIKAEITDPTSEQGLTSFLDTLNTLISGFDNTSGSQTYTGTVKQYIDGIQQTLQTSINSKASTTALESEATTRQTNDNTLDGKITAEETARTNADNTLDGKITAEETARTNADTALTTRINGIDQTIEDNEQVTAAALNDLEDRKFNTTDAKEIEVVTSVSYENGTLSLTTATVKVLDFTINQS